MCHKVLLQVAEWNHECSFVTDSELRVVFLSSAGKPVFDDSGELVCTKPFPSMPTHFWNDEDGIKYTKAYFTKFQGVCVCVCVYVCVSACVCVCVLKAQC